MAIIRYLLKDLETLGLTEYKNNLILSEHGPYGGDEQN